METFEPFQGSLDILGVTSQSVKQWSEQAITDRKKIFRNGLGAFDEDEFRHSETTAYVKVTILPLEDKF